MSNVELTETDIAERIASLLPPELWNRYCHLTYARMAEVPELAEYARVLREAEMNWFSACRRRHHQANLVSSKNRIAGGERSLVT